MGVVPSLRPLGSALWDQGNGEREIIHTSLRPPELIMGTIAETPAFLSTSRTFTISQSTSGSVPMSIGFEEAGRTQSRYSPPEDHAGRVQR